MFYNSWTYAFAWEMCMRNSFKFTVCADSGPVWWYWTQSKVSLLPVSLLESRDFTHWLSFVRRLTLGRTCWEMWGLSFSGYRHQWFSRPVCRTSDLWHPCQTFVKGGTGLSCSWMKFMQGGLYFQIWHPCQTFVKGGTGLSCSWMKFMQGGLYFQIGQCPPQPFLKFD